MLVGFSLVVPSFASMLVISFPAIHECAHTLCMWTLCGVCEHKIVLTYVLPKSQPKRT